jgi:hypothetical protein
LHIHPDKIRIISIWNVFERFSFSKLHDNPNEELAKLILMKLNEAWSQFEKRN